MEMQIRKLFATVITVIVIFAALTVGVTAAEAPVAAYDGYIVKLDSSPHRSILSTFDISLESVPHSDNLYLTDDFESARELLDSGIAEYVEPNYILEPLSESAAGTPNDPKYSQQWTLDAINYLSLYSGGYNGGNVTVAIIDSGLYSWHDEDKVYHGHEEFENVKISPYSKNFLGSEEETVKSVYYYRDQTKVGHGSFVASQIAAGTDNGKGIAGIADAVELMILRCISAGNSEEFPYDERYDANSGSVALVASAIRYAADMGADVINISLGTTSESNILTLQNAVNYANDRGVIIVAAAGNSGSRTLFYPAACENVIGVGSVSRSGDKLEHSTFSQYNNSISITAPGDSVLGVSVYPSSDGKVYASPEESYINGSGTSYSSPVVAAMAAIVKSINPELDHDDFKGLLAVTAADYGTSGWDTDYGYGVLDSSAMLEALTVTEYSIDYQLCDQPGTVGQFPQAYPNSYVLGRKDDLKLPVPAREGYRFEGWYEAADYSGEPVTVLPLGALGMVKSSVFGGEVSYYIDQLTFYAKWSEIPIIQSVMVLDYPANPVNADSFSVKIPKSAVTDLSELTADDISVITSSAVENVSIDVIEGNNSLWSIVLAGSPVTSYTLLIEISEYDMPFVAEGASTQNGTALLSSLCGSESAKAYTAEVSSWFTNAESYSIVSSDGKGEALIERDRLTYTPNNNSDGDYSGQTVTIVLEASNPDFESEDSITVEVTIGRSPSSSLIVPPAYSYDLYTNSEGINIIITLYDNTLNGIYLNGSPLSAENYNVSASGGEGGDMVDSVKLGLSHSFLRDLPVGESEIIFKFSAGSDSKLVLSISDSTPKHSVSFYSETSDIEPFYSSSDIRDGSSLTLPATEPKKDGYIFTGWYLSDGSTRITSNKVVTSSFLVYAKWSKDPGGGIPPGGGEILPGGGGIPGGEWAPLEEAESGSTVLAVGGAHSTELKVIVSGDSATIEALTDSDMEVLALATAAAGKPLSIDFSSLGDKLDTAVIPSGILFGLGDYGANGIAITMPDGKAVSLDSAALGVLLSAGSGDLKLSVRKLQSDELSNEQKGLIGSAAVIDLAAYIGARQVHGFGGGMATVSIPVNGEPAENTIVWRMTTNADGKVSLEAIDCRYNAATKCYEFQTGRFSEYVIGVYPFIDTPDSGWYYEDAVYAYVNALFKGTSDTAFSPAAAMTRGMLVTVLWRMENSPKLSQKAEFTDVNSNDWYAEATVWAVTNEIISGYGKGKIGPDDNITREQLATILYRYAQYKNYDISAADESHITSFKDGRSVSNYAATAMNWACEIGLIQGSGGSLLPRGDASRAQVAAILRRFSENVARCDP